MNTWILIVALVGINKAAVDHIEFDNLKACEYAATKVEAGVKKNGWATYYTICVPKRMP